MNNKMTWKEYIVLIVLFIIGHAHWGIWAVKFEIQGDDTCYEMAISTYIWFVMNICFMLYWSSQQVLTITTEYSEVEGKNKIKAKAD